MDIINVFLCLIVLLTTTWYLIKTRYAFWKTMGVPYVEPSFPFGNLKEMGKKYSFHTCELMKRYYDEYKHKGPMLGLYFFFSPAVLVMDIELLKKIMITDFDVFNARQYYYNERDDPLSAHLFSIEGPKWKRLRAQLTPTFTSGKMKYMFNAVTTVGERLTGRLERLVGSNPDIEIKDIWSRYTTDVIGCCGFGIECNTLNGENTLFRDMGKMGFEKPRRNLMLQPLFNRYRPLANFLHIKHIPDESADFIFNMVKETIAYRESTSDQRNDFMNLLIELKNNPNTEKGMKPLTVEEIGAQCYVFFVAALETSSTLLSFCSYELGLRTDIQEKVRQEVKAVLEKHDGQFTYEAIKEMKYLEQVLNEALRKYPPLAGLTRAPYRDYIVPGTQFVIPKWCTVIIPVYAIHHDPNLYPNPEMFDPDRFSSVEISKRDSFTFMPFGAGPRNCIGLRFGMMQAKIAMAMVLNKFEFTLSSDMKIPLKLSKKHFVISSDTGIKLNMKQILN